MKNTFIRNLETGHIFELGQLSLTEQEIIEFATLFDPLEFHTSKEAAEKSIFNGLVASGPHLFNVFYRTKWIPSFGNSVIAGMELTNWKFLKPVYANRKMTCKVTVAALDYDTERNRTAIKWHFDFMNEKNELVQVLDVSILHDAMK